MNLNQVRGTSLRAEKLAKEASRQRERRINRPEYKALQEQYNSGKITKKEFLLRRKSITFS